MAKLSVSMEEDLAEEHGDIQTFVFLDFETTGLLHERGKVTEMCLLAVTKSDLMETRFPRVTNKLTLCFNPRKSLTRTAMDVSGLNLDMLKEQRAMTSQSVDLINAFLSHLHEPICLLAHNGNKFDFRVFMSELYAINQVDALKKALLCADTLVAFKSLNDLSSAAESSGSRPEKRKSETSTSYSNTTPLKKSKSLPVDTKGTSKVVAKLAAKKAVPKMEKSASIPSLYSRAPFKLENLYFRVFGEMPTMGHTAEGDCVTLLKIAQRSPGFIHWVNKNSVKFSTIRPAYT